MAGQTPRMTDEESWEAYKIQLARLGRTPAFSYEVFCQKARESEAIIYKAMHPSKGQQFKDFLSDLGYLITNLGMYSSDPTLARQAIVYNAEQQIGMQREIAAEQQARAAQAAAEQRAQDEAREEARMRLLAREMAKEMVAELERQRKLT